MSTSVATRLIAVSTGILGTGATAIHYYFGLRLRNTVDFSGGNLQNRKNDGQNKASLPSRLSVLSQNIWCSFVYGGPKRRQRLKLFIDNLAEDKPDILCLQEMFIFAIGPLLVCGDFDYLHHELVHTLGYSYYSDPMQTLPSVFGGNSGLMIYSKYPLQECHSSAFDTNIRRLWSAKGWMSAQIALSSDADKDKQSNGPSLRIINTHLEHKNRDYKVKQIEVLRDAIMRGNHDEYRVCLGDFNICSKFTFDNECAAPHRLYDILQRTMAQCGLQHDVFCEQERTFRATEEEPNACYDHMFVNENMKQIIKASMIMDYCDNKQKDKKEKEDELVMSDHYGLCIQLKLDANKLTAALE